MILETSVGLPVIALGIAVKKVIDTNKKLEKYSPFNSVIDNTDRRVNKVNNRKEFFRVSLAEIERETKKLHGELKLTKFAEARNYRETLAIENKGVA